MDKNEELKKLHNVLFDLLCEFDRICKKHNIEYFLDSGTALGAVRHGGFIPWDDDIDVGMIRSEYERFLKVAAEEAGPDYFLLTKETEPAYFKYHAKLVKKHTIFPEPYTKNYKHRGIFIDIFPFDKVSDNKNERRQNFKWNQYHLRFIRLKKRKFSEVKNSNLLLWSLLKLVPLTYLEKRAEKLWLKYNNTDASGFTCYLYKVIEKRDIVFPVSTISPSTTINFNGKEFQIMNNVDDYLKIMYNNYMELPPVDKRVSHLIDNIIFDTRQ